jgi:FtsZ-binding cell division protein ZapB
MAPSSSLRSGSKRAPRTPPPTKNKKRRAFHGKAVRWQEVECEIILDGYSSEELSDVVDKYLSPRGQNKLAWIDSPGRKRRQPIRELSTSGPPELKFIPASLPASLPAQGPHEAATVTDHQMAAMAAQMERMSAQMDADARMDARVDARVDAKVGQLVNEIKVLKDEVKVLKTDNHRLTADNRRMATDIERLQNGQKTLNRDFTVSPNPLRLTILG